MVTSTKENILGLDIEGDKNRNCVTLDYIDFPSCLEIFIK